MTSPPVDIRWTACRPVFPLVLASLVAVIWVHRVHPVWFIAPIVHIDPWLYWGTGEDFGYLAQNWGSTYYFRRWTLVLPNYTFQHLFSPYLAQFLLRSCLMFGVCLLGGLFALRLTGMLSASILTIYGFTYADFFVRSIGTSYNQGTGLLLFFAAACLLVRPAIGSERVTRRLLHGVAIGVVVGLLFVTYPWTLYLWFTFAVLGLFQAASWSSSRHERLVSLGLVVSGCAVGFAIIVAVDLQVARIFGLRWPNVVSYALEVGRGLSAAKVTVAPSDFFFKQVLTSSSYALIGVAVAGLLFVFGKSVPGRLPLAASVLVLSGTYLADPWTGANAHFVMQTIIYLTALVIVSIALMASFVITEAGQQGSWVMRIIRVLGVGVVAVLSSRQMSTVTAENWWVPVTAVGICAVLLGVMRVLTERRIVALLVMALGTTASAVALALTMTIWRTGGNFVDANDAAPYLQRLSTEHRSLMTRAREDSRMAWITDLRPHSGWSTNISAAYGLYSTYALGYNPPSLQCGQLNWILSIPNSTVVLYGASSQFVGAQMIENLAKPCQAVKLTPRLNPPASAIWFDISRP